MAASNTPPEWELRRRRILGLYIDEDFPLRNVRRILAEEGFKASESQYRSRFKAWDVRKKKPHGKKRTEKDATVANECHGNSNESGVPVGPIEQIPLRSNVDTDMPILPRISLGKEAATQHEPRDLLSLVSSHEPREHLATECPQTEGVGTRSTTSHAHGDLIDAFEAQEFHAMGSMAPGLNDFWMGQMPDTQLGFDAATESALLSGDLINTASMLQVADPFWVPETQY